MPLRVHLKKMNFKVKTVVSVEPYSLF